MVRVNTKLNDSRTRRSLGWCRSNNKRLSQTNKKYRIKPRFTELVKLIEKLLNRFIFLTDGYSGANPIVQVFWRPAIYK